MTPASLYFNVAFPRTNTKTQTYMTSSAAVFQAGKLLLATAAQPWCNIGLAELRHGKNGKKPTRRHPHKSPEAVCSIGSVSELRRSNRRPWGFRTTRLWQWNKTLPRPLQDMEPVSRPGPPGTRGQLGCVGWSSSNVTMNPVYRWRSIEKFFEEPQLHPTPSGWVGTLRLWPHRSPPQRLAPPVLKSPLTLVSRGCSRNMLMFMMKSMRFTRVQRLGTHMLTSIRCRWMSKMTKCVEQALTNAIRGCGASASRLPASRLLHPAVVDQHRCKYKAAVLHSDASLRRHLSLSLSE